MSAPVDVLEVLAFAVGKEGTHPPPTPTHFDEALAAVAELVEKAKAANSMISTAQAFVRAMELQRVGLPMSAQLAPELSQTYRDLKAALAKFGGAA